MVKGLAVFFINTPILQHFNTLLPKLAITHGNVNITLLLLIVPQFLSLSYRCSNSGCSMNALNLDRNVWIGAPSITR